MRKISIAVFFFVLIFNLADGLTAAERNRNQTAQFKLVNTIEPDELDNFSKYKLYGKHFYGLSYKTVYQYDLNGKLIQTIGKRGEGPGEFSFIIDAFIEKNRITIADFKFSIAEFDPDGKLKHSRKLKLPLNDLIAIFRVSGTLWCLKGRIVQSKNKKSFTRKIDLFNVDKKIIFSSFNDGRYTTALSWSGRQIGGPMFPAPFSNRIVPIVGGDGTLRLFFTRDRRFLSFDGKNISRHTISSDLKAEAVTTAHKAEFFAQLEDANRKKMSKKMKDSISFPETKELFTGAIKWGEDYALVRDGHFLIIDYKGKMQQKIDFPEGIRFDSDVKLRFADRVLIYDSGFLYFVDDDAECIRKFRLLSPLQ